MSKHDKYILIIVNQIGECLVIDKGLKFFRRDAPKSKSVWSYRTDNLFHFRARLDNTCRIWLDTNSNPDSVLRVYVYNKSGLIWSGYSDAKITNRRILGKNKMWSMEDIEFSYDNQLDINTDTIGELDGLVKQLSRQSALNELF